MSANFDPVLAHSDVVHRVAVDRLKWELLGYPYPSPLLPAPLCDSRYYYYYYGYPWVAPGTSLQYHYSMGFRDGLKSAAGDGRAQRPSSPPPPPPRTETSKLRQGATKASSTTTTTCEVSGSYPSDPMGFPAGSYRRPLSPFPVSTDTSYDNLPAGWPYGCKPFYFRHADPPSVRYF